MGQQLPSNALDLNCAMPKRFKRKGIIECQATLVFAASSIDAVNTVVDDPSLTFTRTSAGTYNLTFPPAVGGVTIEVVEMFSPALTVVTDIVTAKNPCPSDGSQGTATLKLLTGTTPTDPAVGDYITIKYCFTTELN